MRIGLGIYLSGGRPLVQPDPPIDWNWQAFDLTAGDSGAWIGYSNGDIAYPPFNPPVGLISGQPTAVTELLSIFQDVGSGDIVVVFHGLYADELQSMQVDFSGHLLEPSGYSEMAGNTWLRFGVLPGNILDGEEYYVLFGWDLQ